MKCRDQETSLSEADNGKSNIELGADLRPVKLKI
jgi:hypothetical protein